MIARTRGIIVTSGMEENSEMEYLERLAETDSPSRERHSRIGKNCSIIAMRSHNGV